MTKLKTAILWGPNDLLAQAMEIFLAEEETWEVIRISEDQGVCSLVEQVRKSKPELIILYQGTYTNDSDPLLKLIQDQPELGVIADQPELRVITVNLENNLMQVYSKRSFRVRKVADLLSIIDDKHFSDHSLQKEVNKTQTNVEDFQP